MSIQDLFTETFDRVITSCRPFDLSFYLKSEKNSFKRFFSLVQCCSLLSRDSLIFSYFVGYFTKIKQVQITLRRLSIILRLKTLVTNHPYLNMKICLVHEFKCIPPFKKAYHVKCLFSEILTNDNCIVRNSKFLMLKKSLNKNKLNNCSASFDLTASFTDISGV